MAETACVSVPAQHCTFQFTEHRRRIVAYQGNEFAIIGLYFARFNGDQKRVLMYILQPLRSESEIGALGVPIAITSAP